MSDLKPSQPDKYESHRPMKDRTPELLQRIERLEAAICKAIDQINNLNDIYDVLNTLDDAINQEAE